MVCQNTTLKPFWGGISMEAPISMTEWQKSTKSMEAPIYLTVWQKKHQINIKKKRKMGKTNSSCFKRDKPILRSTHWMFRPSNTCTSLLPLTYTSMSSLTCPSLTNNTSPLNSLSRMTSVFQVYHIASKAYVLLPHFLLCMSTFSNYLHSFLVLCIAYLFLLLSISISFTLFLRFVNCEFFSLFCQN